MVKGLIALLPIGDVNSEDIDELVSSLGAVFSRRIVVLDAMDIPYETADREKKYDLVRVLDGTDQVQYDVVRFMELARITAVGSKNRNDKLLGITHEDLFTPGLNFIFGQAEINGKAAVISTARLKYHSFWSNGRSKLVPRELYLPRLVKEAVHELGHTYGLRHCKNRKCVMTFSNSLEDTDLKSERFCDKCSSIQRQRQIAKIISDEMR
jgi:archaemetzincin